MVQSPRHTESISGVSLLWQTEEAGVAVWDDDEGDQPRLEEEWQSYHVFSVSPNSEEFRFEAETTGEDSEEGTETTYPGEGRYGLALTISLAAPIAAISGIKDGVQDDVPQSTQGMGVPNRRICHNQ